MLTLGYSLIGIASGCVIILLLSTEAHLFLRSFFRQPALILLGKYSYAMYLFHWPTILIYKSIFSVMQVSGVVFWCIYLLLCLTTTVGAALLSWHLLEKHALGLKRFLT